MKINLDELNSLSQKRLRLSFNEPLQVEGAVKPVVGDILVSASIGGIKVRGRVTTLLKLSCHVCLRPYFHALSVDIDEKFATPAESNHDDRQKERELTRDDFYEVLPDDGLLDINDVVYQAVTLASPVFCRCGDECPGPPAASQASADGDSGDSSEAPEEKEDLDPRWNNLKTLLHKRDSGENS